MWKIRLGIVGCGIVVKIFYILVLKEFFDIFEVVVVMSRIKEYVVECVEFVGGVEVFESYEEFFWLGEVDVVDLVFFVELNFLFIKKVVENGVYVICEKLILIDVKIGKEIVKIVNGLDVVVYIVENFRYVFVFWKVKELIDVGKIGEFVFMSWYVWVGMDEGNFYVYIGWRKSLKYVGGFFLDGGVYYVVVMRFIFGDVVWIFVVVCDFFLFFGGFDFMLFFFEFESGVVGIYIVGYLIKGKDRFEIVGIDGRMFVEWDRIFFNGEEIGVNLENSYKFEFEDFYRVVMGERENVFGSFFEVLKDFVVIEVVVKFNGYRIDFKFLLDWFG